MTSQPKLRRFRRQAPAAKDSGTLPLRPSARGWRGRGGGLDSVIDVPGQWRTTTKQGCGLWPFAVGAGVPQVGVPFGNHLYTGADVFCDPISWFVDAKYIAQPSLFLLGLMGLGKSTALTRMILGLLGMGTLPLVLGDLKPDYVDAMRANGAQVITLGDGVGFLNVLDPGGARAAADRLTGSARDQLIADIQTRRLTTVGALIQILRGTPPTEREESILGRAFDVLDERHFTLPPGHLGPTRPPILPDLLEVVREGPESLRQAAVDRGDDDRYRAITEDLEASLMSLIGGVIGGPFSRHTTEPMDPTRPVVYDVSRLRDAKRRTAAAALMACWSDGFAAVNAAQVLADEGLEPRRHYFIVMDELWDALRVGEGMVDRVDSTMRLTRTLGVGIALCSHTMADLEALPREEDRAKARGFVERAGVVVSAGLPPAEMPLLNKAIRLTAEDERELTSWCDPEDWSFGEDEWIELRRKVHAQNGLEPRYPEENTRVGVGRFLVKVRGRPGIPVQLTLTQAERQLAHSSRRWMTRSSLGPLQTPQDEE